MKQPTLRKKVMPGLYRSASQASRYSQAVYFWCLGGYLVLLVCAAFVSFLWPANVAGAISSAILFMVTLVILVGLRVKRPDDIWYNGRAVAESVKTRTWRWVMRAEPYSMTNAEVARSKFTDDLREILRQNRTLFEYLGAQSVASAPISKEMESLRALPVEERIAIYRRERIEAQAHWYEKKAKDNRTQARMWFWISVVLHSSAIALLLYRVSSPTQSLPIEVISTAAGAALTWLQSKKFNELGSSYTLTAGEIALMLSDAALVKDENELSVLVLDSETAFSREHTQWVARKNS
ncbi:MAG: DUF4231 domain-containing protein [Cyanobacteria bacterium J06649_4]